MTGSALPTSADDLTLDVLNRIVGREAPEALLTGFDVLESHVWGGGNASSAGRIIIQPRYAAPAPDLPGKLVLKVARAAPEEPDKPIPIAGAGGALYQNEVAVYERLRPSTFLEAPRTFGGAHDQQSNALLLIMEDLGERGGSFASVIVPTSMEPSMERMQSILEQLAVLHARYWQSPQLETSLSWMEAHTEGWLHDQFSNPAAVPRFIAQQVEQEQFKKEMVERLSVTTDDLFAQLLKVQQHRARLPQTVCHGDTHIGNTYILPGDSAGLLDWQLTSRGYAMHDVSYIIATGLSVAQRRAAGVNCWLITGIACLRMAVPSRPRWMKCGRNTARLWSGASTSAGSRHRWSIMAGKSASWPICD